MYQYSESVLTTRETSYEAAADQCAEALVLTTMLSFFSIDDIYRVLFCADTVVEGAEHTEGDDGTSWRSLVSSQQTVDAYKIEECLCSGRRTNGVMRCTSWCMLGATTCFWWKS